jgi:signal peptidase I
MEQSTEADVPATEPRSVAARIGILALNLVAPGLGLIRLGRLRAGLGYAFGPLAALLILAVIAAVAPPVTFPVYVVVMPLMILIAILVLVIPIVLSWRWSSFIETKRWWSRWYGLVAIWLLATVASQLLVEAYHRRLYKPYYIPSEAMMPGLVKNDRLLADMSDRRPRRGEVIIFRAPGGSDYIKRVAAIGGDNIEMRAGVPIINGVAVDERPAGTMQMESPHFGPPVARRLSEQLPGEQGRHYILDDQISEYDNTPVVKVPIGSVFVLGDNRDHSADSRVPIEADGVGFVPLAAVRGRPLFITLGAELARSGTRINP